jgi:hypothetical protein
MSATEANRIMTSEQSVRIAVERFTEASATFARSLDIWIRKYGKDRGDSASRRIVLLDRRSQLERLAVASRTRRSIGFYGESQCGKSNLVSRIGQGLGVRATPAGSLLVRDPSNDPTRAPWAADGHEGAIEFAKWLNPISNKEATGIICRLSSEGPEPAMPGCFVAKVLSHADLVISLALGHIDEIVDQPGPRHAHEAMDELRSAPREDDTQGFMSELLQAWRFLRERRIESSPRLRHLEEAGWEDFVRDCFLAGKRPVWNPQDVRGTPFSRLVGMLWDGQPELDEVYRRLLDVIVKLGGAEEVSIAAQDVCRSDPSDGPGRPSLLDIGHIDNLFAELAASGGVQVHYRTRHGAVRTLGLSRSALVAMVRELVLPVDGATGEEGVDILDYPGARKSAPAQSFQRHAEPAKLALQVLRRGKLNRLFLSGVEFQDCSALCLVVTGNGNLEAGPVVKQALAAWLSREGWVPSDQVVVPELLPHEEPPPPVDPPLVVAVTKADTLLNDKGHALFGGRLREIDLEYCGSIPWLGKWSEAGPFRRVHWVHNPELEGIRRPFQLPDPSKDLIRSGYRADEQVLLHVDDAERRLEALISDPPRDVLELFDVLRNVVLRVDRDARIVDAALDELEALVRDANRDYVGANDPERLRREREDAELDVMAIEAALARGLNPVAELLRALQMTASDVQRAYATAAEESASLDAGEIGTVGFDDFWAALRQRFAVQLDDRLGRSAPWLQYMGDSQNPRQGRLGSIAQHFRDIPSSAWFRDRIESAIGGMVRNRNASALADGALGAIASTLWNRSMVWLDHVPAVQQTLPALPPKLQQSHASSTKILAHWRARLPEVYAGLVDPRNTSRPGNADLGILRGQLHEGVRSLRVALSAVGRSAGPRARTLEIRLKAIAESLADAAQTDGAASPGG